MLNRYNKDWVQHRLDVICWRNQRIYSNGWNLRYITQITFLFSGNFFLVISIMNQRKNNRVKFGWSRPKRFSQKSCLKHTQNWSWCPLNNVCNPNERQIVVNMSLLGQGVNGKSVASLATNASTFSINALVQKRHVHNDLKFVWITNIVERTSASNLGMFKHSVPTHTLASRVWPLTPQLFPLPPWSKSDMLTTI
jgi:hypothetical protein